MDKETIDLTGKISTFGYRVSLPPLVPDIPAIFRYDLFPESQQIIRFMPLKEHVGYFELLAPMPFITICIKRKNYLSYSYRITARVKRRKILPSGEVECDVTGVIHAMDYTLRGRLALKAVALMRRLIRDYERFTGAGSDE